MIGYPKWFSKNLIHSIFFLSFVTGALLFPTILVLKLEWNFPWRLPTEQRDWIVILHVVLGFTVFTVLGALSSVHVRLGFRKKAKRVSGVALMSFIVGLGMTGMGILYLGDEKLSTYASVVHFSIGTLLTLSYVIHMLTKVESKKTTRSLRQ
ncbi:hypothetical protein [Bdellovibrio sp. BCCA]|uniref:hypothetical protein n=1 Tax=Bdellovibrio sp. BCCA TaxID=3136281 RepID=UPI0030F03B7A